MIVWAGPFGSPQLWQLSDSGSSSKLNAPLCESRRRNHQPASPFLKNVGMIELELGSNSYVTSCSLYLITPSSGFSKSRFRVFSCISLWGYSFWYGKAFIVAYRWSRRIPMSYQMNPIASDLCAAPFQDLHSLYILFLHKA